MIIGYARERVIHYRVIKDEAHKLLKVIKPLWNEGSAEDRQRIMKLVLERAWVQGEEMIAQWIRPKNLIWVREGLRHREREKVELTNLPDYLRKLHKENGNLRLLESYRCGSDGYRTILYHIRHHSRPDNTDLLLHASRQEFVFMFGLFTCVCAETSPHCHFRIR